MNRNRPQESLARRGESLARRHLKKKGYRILARNYACPIGELDLIALDGKTLVFVEVKTLRDDRRIQPADSVHAAKQARIRKTARFYLSAKRADDVPARFDVVAVTLPDDGPPHIEHLTDAF